MLINCIRRVVSFSSDLKGDLEPGGVTSVFFALIFCKRWFNMIESENDYAWANFFPNQFLHFLKTSIFLLLWQPISDRENAIVKTSSSLRNQVHITGSLQKMRYAVLLIVGSVVNYAVETLPHNKSCLKGQFAEYNLNRKILLQKIPF